MNKIHIGVYGIIIKNNQILLIKKSRGPYKGKLDLPGGSLEHGESIDKDLFREILEETGIKISKFKLFDNYTHKVDFTDERGKISMYHIGMIYKIISFDDKNLKLQGDSEDSLGAKWYLIKNLKKDTVSPFADRVLKEL